MRVYIINLLLTVNLQKLIFPDTPKANNFPLRLSFHGCNSNGPDSQFRLRGGTQALPLKVAERLTKRHGKRQVVLLRHEVTKVTTMEVGMGGEMVLLMEEIGWENHLGLVAHSIFLQGFITSQVVVFGISSINSISWERSHIPGPQSTYLWADEFPFPKVGYDV